MKKQKSFDTGPELRLRRLLYHRGLRYRVHSEVVPGTRRKVDLVFVTAKVAVFLDGCFWHGCSTHGSIPVANASWWSAKLNENRSRDQDTDVRLTGAGWHVMRVWEHEDLDAAAGVIEAAVRERSPRRSLQSVPIKDIKANAVPVQAARATTAHTSARPVPV